MDKNLEPIIMASYAELCVSWRMAHVANLVQADDLNAKLSSLEGVIKAFDLGQAKPRPAGEAPRPTPRAASPFKKGARDKDEAGMMLED